MPTRILNFSHPLTDKQLEQITQSWGEIDDVITVKVQLDQAAPIEDQIKAILDDLGYIEDISHTLINLPGLAAAAVVLYEQLRYRHTRGDIHCIRMKPVPGPAGMSFELAEILCL